MLFLGTGSADGIPNPFCTCRICENARKVGGKECRTRASFLLDETTLIDMGQDFFTQARDYSLRFDKLENVLCTHMHDDHINYFFLWERLVKRAGTDKPLHVWFTGEAEKFFTDFYFVSPLVEGGKRMASAPNAVLHKMEFGKPEIIGSKKVTPLRGNHATAFEKNSSNFLIEENGKKLYYAVDSGYFIDETFQALEGQALDLFIGECTFPAKDLVRREDGHMDLIRVMENLDKLYEIGAVNDKTRVFLTHIGPVGMTHEELCRYFETIDRPYSITVAYDGLEI